MTSRRLVWLAGLAAAVTLTVAAAWHGRSRIPALDPPALSAAIARLVSGIPAPGRDAAVEPPAPGAAGQTLPEPANEPARRRRDVAWSVVRDDDRSIALEGVLPSAQARAALVRAVGAAAPDVPLDDRTRTGTAAAPDVPSALVGQLVALLGQGRIDVVDDRLSVSGEALDPQAAGAIETLIAADLPGTGLARGDIGVLTRPLSPYRVAIRREAGRIALTGHLPDERTRSALIAALRERLFGERVVDRTRVAAGAPEALLQAVLAGIDVLGLLAEGEIAASDRALRITGRSLYRESARRLRASSQRIAPPGWSVEVAVDGPGEPETLDAAACHRRLVEEAGRRPLRFAPGSADLPPEGYPLLDALAALAGACPSERIEVAGYDDPAAAEPTATATVGADATPVKRDESRPGSTAPGSRGTALVNPLQTSGPRRNTDAKVKPASATAASSAPAPEPEPALPRRRALAVIDYLVKAGVREAQLSVVEVAPASARQAGFAFRSR